MSWYQILMSIAIFNELVIIMGINAYDLSHLPEPLPFSDREAGTQAGLGDPDDDRTHDHPDLPACQRPLPR